MKLHAKMLLILGPAFAVFAALLILIARIVLLSQFASLERDDVKLAQHHVDRSIADQFHKLERVARDYAEWDDMFEAMFSRDMARLKAILHEKMMRRFDLNQAVLFDLRGDIVFATQYERHENKFVTIDGPMLERLQGLREWVVHDETYATWRVLPGNVALIYKARVLPGMSMAQPVGTLVLVQFFDEEPQRQIKEETGLQLSFAPWNTNQGVSETTASNLGYYEVNGETLAAYRVYRDHAGEPILLARFTLPRDIYNQGQQAILVFLMIMMILGLAVLLIVSVLVRTQILDRIALMNATCHRIAREGDESLRLSVSERDEVGQLKGSINQMLDSLATARHEREVTEQRFLMLVGESKLGVFVYQKELFVYVNQALADMCGYQREEMTGQLGPLRLVHPEDHAVMVEQIRRREAGEIEIAHYVVRLCRKDGSVFYAEIHGQSVQYHAGPAAQGIIIDITQRRIAEDALAEQRNFLRKMIEHLPLAVWAKRAGDRRYVLWNNKASHFFNLEAERVLGRSDEELFPPELAQRFGEEDNQVAGQVREIDVPKLLIDLPDRERMITHMVKVPLFDEQGRVQYILGLAEDITEQVNSRRERRHLEKRMQQAQKLESLGVLAGGIAHDFNNLLVSILGNVQLAGTLLGDAAKPRQYLANAEIAVQRAAELCQQLLAYAGKGRFLIQRVNLATVVEEMLKLLEVSIHRRAELRIELDRELPPVEADVTQLRQIIMNLITNAADAMIGQRGTITIRTGWQAGPTTDSPLEFQVGNDPEGLASWIEVSDTGCGIELETLARIFEPFYSTKMVGRGLGLSAVLGIVRSHGGAIHVVSEPGEGSSFKIIFPALTPADIVESNPVAFPEPAAPAHAGNGHKTGSTGAPQKIMIVDDEAPVRDVAQAILESAGYIALACEDGEASLRTLEEQPDICMVLLDLTMPSMSGEEVFLKLHGRRPDLPIVLMSGYSSDDILGRLPGIRPAAFVQKPFRYQDLLDEVARQLARSNTEGGR